MMNRRELFLGVAMTMAAAAMLAISAPTASAKEETVTLEITGMT